MYDGIENLLSQMTLQEKVSMLAGTNMWYRVPVERLGIPSLKMTDGPNGARGAGGFTQGVKATCFPAEISLASTWNTELVERVGQSLAHEAKMKSAKVLLAPTVNIQRSPLGGRNSECFSEDPYLSARLAVAYINGLQKEGVGASIKHYVCNDQEFERTSISSEVRERALREIYLLPFQVAVREATPWTIMAAYNYVNGIAASENPYLLTEILRDEWGYDGVVVSDWLFSVKSTAASVNAGLDVEMPEPQWRGEKLLQAVERGEVKESTLNTSVRRLLALLVKAGLFEHRQEQLAQLALTLLQERERSVERRITVLEALLQPLVGRQLSAPPTPEAEQEPRTLPGPRPLHPVGQLARSRRPPLIEYSAPGIYMIISAQEGEVQLKPDSRAWFDWLATLSSFRFVGPAGRFTAHRGYNQGHQTRFWSASRCVHRHTYKHSLGVTESLTIASLEHIAARLQSDRDAR